VIEANDVAATHVIATEAVAKAQGFVASAETILGARIEVITAQREAELAALAVSRTFPELAKKHHLVVDVRDASTEIVEVEGGRIVAATSVPIGAAQLSKRYLRHDPSTGAEQNAVERAIDKALKPVRRPNGIAVVGTSKTAATIAALELATDDPDRVTGLRIAHRFVFSWSMRLARVTLAKRKTIPGIAPERANVIVGGVAIYARLLTWANAAELVTSDRGIRWGLAFERGNAPVKPPARSAKRKPGRPGKPMG
jgi:exopolyphosphatase/guanosine-5'-triphosphate,3'-diphosphate pyrophosphatase